MGTRDEWAILTYRFGEDHHTIGHRLDQTDPFQIRLMVVSPVAMQIDKDPGGSEAGVLLGAENHPGITGLQRAIRDHTANL